MTNMSHLRLEEYIAIIDIETTNFLMKGGLIVEVGISRLHLPTGKVDILYDSVVREDLFNESTVNEYRNSWIFQNSTLTPEMVLAAPRLEDERIKIQAIFDAYQITAFNTQFDLTFLGDRKFQITTLACIMIMCTSVVGAKNRNGGVKYPSVEEAWNHFFPDVPLNHEHRAIKDSIEEAQILYQCLLQKSNV